MRGAAWVVVVALGLAAAGCPAPSVIDGGMDAPTSDAPDVDAAADGAIDAELDVGSPIDASSDADPADADLDGPTFDAPLLDAALLDAPLLDAPLLDAPLVLSDAPILRMVEMVSHPPASPIAPFATCTVTTSTDAISAATHLPPCTPFDYPFLPPSAGPHFSVWANFGTYAAPVPWGFLVHAMEHGGVVLAYNCATSSDCDAVRTEFQAIIDARGVDPLCRMEDWPNRIIVVPDPTLSVPIAAVAWRNVYEATCLDPTSLRAFVDAHYGMATESLCAGGTDRSATGWCP